VQIATSKVKSISILLLVIGGLCLWYFYTKSQDDWQKKTLLYSFSLKNTSHDFLHDVVFDVLLPSEIKHNQNYQFAQTLDAQSQSNTKRFVKKIPPYGTKVVSFTLEINKNNIPRLDSVDGKDYLAESQYIQIHDPSIQSLAKQLKAETPELTAKNIYNWLINNIVSENYSPESRGALFTLNSKVGDCTEFAYLFVALARANGIPARSVRGLYIPQQSMVVNPMDYHDWAEFYDGDHWILVDAQKQIFNDSYSNYLIINWFADSNNETKRFNVSDERISVSFQ
jgi:transglutaminase-like putative cysteine protease